MGLSIHYSGIIRSILLVEQLIEETADVCQSMSWKFNIIREFGKEGVNGIIFSPENCEPVFLTFLPDRRMCSPINLMNKDPYAANGLDPELIYTTSTKTQFAGPGTHIALLKFLKYLKEKYFEKFEMNDEGYYWETDNEKILLERFTEYNNLLTSVKDVLGKINYSLGENIESLADRIERAIKKKLGKRNKPD